MLVEPPNSPPTSGGQDSPALHMRSREPHGILGLLLIDGARDGARAFLLDPVASASTRSRGGVVGVSGYQEGEEAPAGGAGGGGGGQGATAVGGPSDRDRQELRAIFVDVQAVLHDLVEREGWLPDELRPQFGDALTAIEGNFADVDRALSDPEINGQLDEVGLLGAPFRLKHDVWVWCKEFGHTGKKATVFMLRVADTIIGSAAVIIPAAEGITEVKEMVEHGIEGKTLLDETRGKRDERG